MLAQNSNKHTFTPALFAALLTVFTVLSGLLLSGPHTSAANTGNLDTSVSVTAACSLSVDDTSHSASVIPGNNVAIGTSTVKAICNDPSGLAVYMVGYTGSQYGNTTLTANINETTQTILTGNAGSPSNSQWNMTLAAVTGTYAPEIVSGYTSAQPIPSQYTKVAYRNTMTDAGLTATGANFTAAFNAYVSMTQPAGTYTGKVKFLLIHPNVLTYDDQTGEPATFAPSTLARDPEAPITFDIAYADANKTKSNGYYKLQDMSSAICNAVDIEQSGTLIDTRDNQTYTVKKLKMSADGSQSACWMSNLNLGHYALTTNLTSANTNLASGISDIPYATFNSWIKSSGTSSYTNPELIRLNAGDDYDNNYGTLYNYAAASAGTYAYPSGSGTGNATSDLCPSGWRLPTGGLSGDFKKLIDAYAIPNNTTIGIEIERLKLLGFSLAGRFASGPPAGQGSFGFYWSSTRSSSSQMYHLSINNGSFISDYASETRNIGESVRCIAQ